MPKSIQQLLVEKITKEGDLTKMCNQLEKCSTLVIPDQAEYFRNTSRFFKSLFEIEYVDVKKMTEDFLELTHLTRNLLYSHAKEQNCEQLNFAVAVIDYKLELVSGPRKLS